MLAGAYYGLSGIPSHWVSSLIAVKDLQNTCDSLYNLRVELNQ